MKPTWFTRTLSLGDSGPDVVAVQRKLGLEQTGVFDTTLEVAVRGAQRVLGYEPTGYVDVALALVLGPAADAHLPPQWWTGAALYPGTPEWNLVLGDRDEAWLRRLQGQHGITPTGVVDEETARILGGLGVGQ